MRWCEFGPGRVGVRLSPFGKYGSMPTDPLVEETFLVPCRATGAPRRGIHPSAHSADARRYMEMAEFSKPRYLDHALLAKARAAFRGTFIWCGGFNDRERAEASLDTGSARTPPPSAGRISQTRTWSSASNTAGSWP